MNIKHIITEMQPVGSADYNTRIAEPYPVGMARYVLTAESDGTVIAAVKFGHNGTVEGHFIMPPKPEPKKIYLVRASHPIIPGVLAGAFATRESANQAAAEYVNIMIHDTNSSDRVKKATAETWADSFSDLRSLMGKTYPVMAMEVEVLPVEQ